MSNATERTSLRAPALPAPRAAKGTAAKSVAAKSAKNRAERRRASKLDVALTGLLERFAASLTSAERARFEAVVSAGRASSLGAALDASEVLKDFFRILSMLASHLAQGRLAPYGPRRARYALEIAAAMSTMIAPEAPAPVTPAPTPVVSAALTAPERRRMTRILWSFARSPEAKSAIGAALLGDTATTARTRSHARLLAAIAFVRDHVSVEIRNDAGITDAVLSSLESEAQGALDEHGAKRDGESARRELRAALSERCGRLVVELRHLVAAARDHRVDDASVAAVSSRFAPARSAKKAAEKKPAPPVNPPGNG